MITITDDMIKSIEEFKENLKDFKEGKIELFKSFGSKMGIYKEGKKESYMVRPRTPGGIVTLEQLKVISSIADKYGDGTIRFTSREDVQLHSVPLDSLEFVLNELIGAELTTKGAGGDSVRNISCSPLSGVDLDEVFDVTPYMLATTNYMMIDPANTQLPRKFKIAFSNSLEDTANATLADIGFVAKIVDGKKGFEVYGAGGLGAGAKLSLKIEEFIEASKALYYVQAMKQLFEKEGDRKNRNKARVRFILQRVGEEEFLRLFNNEVNQLKGDANLDINLVGIEAVETGESIVKNKLSNEYNANFKDENRDINKPEWMELYNNIVIKQKQLGEYSLYIHGHGGTMNSKDLNKITEFISNSQSELSIRLTMTQGFFVRGLMEEEVKELINVVSDFSSRFNIINSVTCVGPTVCNFGVNNSKAMLKAVIELLSGETQEVKNALPRIHISGCHNSCGQHQVGIIGLLGKRKRSEDGVIPTYSITFNGEVGSGRSKFGEIYGEIPAKKIPTFLVKLSKLKVASGYQDFIEFLENKDNTIRGLIDEYSLLDSKEENLDIYSDF